MVWGQWFVEMGMRSALKEMFDKEARPNVQIRETKELVELVETG